MSEEPQERTEGEPEFQSMRQGLGRPVALGMLVVALGVGAFLVQRRFAAQNHQTQVQRIADAWSELDRCLLGDVTLRHERRSQYLRRVELGIPTAVRELLPAQRIAEWPYRCAHHANDVTHALFELRTDEGNLRMFGALASQAASNLERGALHTGRSDARAYLDELFAMRERVTLPPPSHAARGPLPPPATHPLTAPALDALLVGEETVALQDASLYEDDFARLLVRTSTEQLCTVRLGALDRVANAQHASLRGLCRPAGRNAGTAQGSLRADPGDGEGVLFVHHNPEPAGSLAAADALTRPFLEHVLDANFAGPGQLVVVLAAAEASATAQRLLGTPPPPPGIAVAPPRVLVRDAHNAWSAPALTLAPDAAARVLGHQLVWLAPAPPPPTTAAPVADAGAAVVPPGDQLFTWDFAWPGSATPQGTPLPVSPLPRVLRTCTTPQGGAAVYAVLEGGRSGELFLYDGRRWSGPRHAEGPDSATLQCFGSAQGTEARFSWLETSPRTLMHQLSCTEAACTSAESLLDEFVSPPVFAALRDRVVLLHSPRGRGLSVRVAPIRELNTADDFVVIDDADHGGMDLMPLSTPLRLAGATGPERVLALVTVRGPASPTYLLAIEDDGGVAPLPPPR